MKKKAKHPYLIFLIAYNDNHLPQSSTIYDITNPGIDSL